MPERPRVLIEEWLPIDKVGAESLRDASAAQKPPLNRLHVWWARRPLTVSRAAILGSLLPAWSEDWPKELKQQFPTREAYYDWFVKLLGILGDPAAVRKLILRAKEEKKNLGSNPYGYSRAFKFNPRPDQVETLQQLLRYSWDTVDPGVSDSMAGGGSIPFEALRYGFTTYASELNPVASVILKATLEYPARFRERLRPLIEAYGRQWCEEVRKRLEQFFPLRPGEQIFCYVWARTVACPYTGKQIPLSPNWWLLTGSEPVAAQPLFDDGAEEARFRIVKGAAACERVKPDAGTVRRGDAVSPWDHYQVVDGDYIKAEAKAGRMGQQLYAVGLKKKGGFEFRAPTLEDLEGVQAVGKALRKKLAEWEAKDLIPAEARYKGPADRSVAYGIVTWADVFSPRQLLSLCTALEVYRDVAARIENEQRENVGAAVRTYLGLALDKAADYNSRMARWHSGRSVMVNTFDRHDFSFKWSHAEFDAAHNLFPWVVDQVADAVGGIVDLIDRANQDLYTKVVGKPAVERLTISRENASSLAGAKDRSVGAIVVDPPYYDNVMYGECSDFFYVWMKRTVGDLYPDWFRDTLTNKDEEAVANVARFAEMGRKKKDLAEQDYQRKMEACFREMHRILRDDGVLTVMFTHKKVEAWDTLGASLINAGFSVHSSWPVHTESEHSLHQAKKNAAASTILLTCRRRAAGGKGVWWEDIQGRVREVAREKAEEYQRLGIGGVDLYIATFGPVLAVISENWPVHTSEVDATTKKPMVLRPEAALEIARQEVIGLRKKGLLLGREVRFDPVSDWYLMAWDAFRAEKFPADEARKLAIALGLDLEEMVIKARRVVSKSTNMVILQRPADRRRKGRVDPEVEVFDCLLDAAHTAMLVFEEDGPRACERWLKARGLDRSTTLRGFLQAMANAIPARRVLGKFVRPEIDLLDKMNDALNLGLEIPIEKEPELEPTTAPMFAVAEAGDEGGEREDQEDEDEA